MFKNKSFLILSICALGFIFGGIYYLYQAFVQVNVVTLEAGGFHPVTLVITEGETVVFKTDTDEPFWPASNVHPTHTAYPAFDPKKPIEGNGTWSFTFTEAGTYAFHDHIKSIFEGEIIVEKKDGTRVLTDCTVEKNTQCWEKMMLETLDTKGVEATFNQLVHLSETEPSFSNDCHSFSHIIGERAYRLYAAHEDFELTPATSLCGYGFYHGFMETMLLTTGNIDEARTFCEFVDKKLTGKASQASNACYHGTGHGAIDGGDPSSWGDVDAMMAPGFKLCGLLAKNELETYLCDTGVFNAIEILSLNQKYGLQELRNDPYAMCNTQPVSRREGCYANMLPIVMQNFNNDFQKSFDYINSRMIDNTVIAIDGHTVNDLTDIDLMVEYFRVHGQEVEYAKNGILLCRAQPVDDRLPCIEGLSWGHIKYGKPGVEYVQNLAFCANTMLTKEEVHSCYSYMLTHLPGRYNPETTKMICAQVPVEYSKQYCI